MSAPSVDSINATYNAAWHTSEAGSGKQQPGAATPGDATGDDHVATAASDPISSRTATAASAPAEELSLGDEVTIDGRGRYTVVGFEINGAAVQLVEPADGKRFTVYAWRVARRGGRNDSDGGSK
jgi:hypothetical protein